MKDNDKGVRLPVQEIVDLFHKGDFGEMAKQIDQYDGYDNYWTELAVDMEAYINHEEDYSIFQNMVIQYTWVKEEIAESKKAEEALKGEDRLLKFAKWIINSIDKEDFSDEDLQQELYLFLEDEEN